MDFLFHFSLIPLFRNGEVYRGCCRGLKTLNQLLLLFILPPSLKPAKKE
ncbi:hypothetical protein BAXH7_03115 [Bacillus amyloliquefaciens XH7]|nr:hypothetical protein LL3_03178 [Bacillus amyloliquefaciens LL3]AEK90235.1 hypothetical protein BAXH7_03115 [Bacillus amyloliquefaciens XH7]